MALQIRRGTDSERLLITPLQGELIYTVDTKKVYVGDGVTLGGILITGSGNGSGEDMSDEQIRAVAAAMFTNGTHTNISFVYNSSTGTINATVTAQGGEGGAVDSVNGQTGVVQLNTDNIPEGSAQYFTTERAQDTAASLFTTGTHSGLTFNYNDELNKIDVSLNSQITANLVGNVTGDVTGDVTAELVTTEVLSAVSLSRNLTTDHQLFFNQGDVPTSVFISMSSSDTNYTPGITFRRSRKDEDDEDQVLQQNDGVGVLNFRAFNGEEDISIASISAISGGAVNNGVIPGTIVFSTLRGISGELEESFRVDRNGVMNFRRSSPQVVTVYNEAHDTAVTTGGITFSRSRNDIISPQPVIENDVISNINFTARTLAVAGVFPTTVALIRAAVDGTVTHPIAPGRLEFHCQNSSGNTSARMILKNDGRLQVNSVESLSGGSLSINASSVSLSRFLNLPVYADDTARDTAIPTPSAGMVIFMQSGTTPAATTQPQYYNGTAWINL
jgi:hypothetical protein